MESCELESRKHKKPKKTQEYFKLPPLEEQAYLTQLSGKVTKCSLELLLEGRSSEPLKKKSYK